MKSKTSKQKAGKKINSKPAKKSVKKAVVKKSVSKKGSAAKTVTKIKKSKEKEISKNSKKKPVKPVLKPVKGIKTPVKKEKPIKKLAKPAKVKKEAAVKEPIDKHKKDIAAIQKSLKPKKGKGGRKPKSKGDDDEPEIIHDELIEQIIQSTKRQSKQPKKPKILQTFVNPINSLTVALSDKDGNTGKKKSGGTVKEPKGKFELEYVIRTSPGILYEFITTPSGLSEWFADDVNIRDGMFTFYWDGSEQKARLIGFKEDKYVRMQWMDKAEGTYFEFKIERDELTGDVSLIITDFADELSDMQTSKLLWDSQIGKLLGVLGSN